MDGPVYLPEEPPGLEAFLTWAPQPVPLLPVVGVLLALAYGWGVWLLACRRIAWPWWRTTLFVTGCGVLVALTGTGLEGYGYRMFSVFMFQQLTAMAAIAQSSTAAMS